MPLKPKTPAHSNSNTRIKRHGHNHHHVKTTLNSLATTNTTTRHHNLQQQQQQQQQQHTASFSTKSDRRNERDDAITRSFHKNATQALDSLVDDDDNFHKAARLLTTIGGNAAPKYPSKLKQKSKHQPPPLPDPTLASAPITPSLISDLIRTLPYSPHHIDHLDELDELAQEQRLKQQQQSRKKSQDNNPSHNPIQNLIATTHEQLKKNSAFFDQQQQEMKKKTSHDRDEQAFRDTFLTSHQQLVDTIASETRLDQQQQQQSHSAQNNTHTDGSLSNNTEGGERNIAQYYRLLDTFDMIKRRANLQLGIIDKMEDLRGIEEIQEFHQHAKTAALNADRQLQRQRYRKDSLSHYPRTGDEDEDKLSDDEFLAEGLPPESLSTSSQRENISTTRLLSIAVPQEHQEIRRTAARLTSALAPKKPKPLSKANAEDLIKQYHVATLPGCYVPLSRLRIWAFSPTGIDAVDDALRRMVLDYDLRHPKANTARLVAFDEYLKETPDEHISPRINLNEPDPFAENGYPLRSTRFIGPRRSPRGRQGQIQAYNLKRRQEKIAARYSAGLSVQEAAEHLARETSAARAALQAHEQAQQSPYDYSFHNPEFDAFAQAPDAEEEEQPDFMPTPDDEEKTVKIQTPYYIVAKYLLLKKQKAFVVSNHTMNEPIFADDAFDGDGMGHGGNDDDDYNNDSGAQEALLAGVVKNKKTKQNTKKNKSTKSKSGNETVLAALPDLDNIGKLQEAAALAEKNVEEIENNNDSSTPKKGKKHKQLPSSQQALPAQLKNKDEPTPQLASTTATTAKNVQSKAKKTKKTQQKQQQQQQQHLLDNSSEEMDAKIENMLSNAFPDSMNHPALYYSDDDMSTEMREEINNILDDEIEKMSQKIKALGLEVESLQAALANGEVVDFGSEFDEYYSRQQQTEEEDNRQHKQLAQSQQQQQQQHHQSHSTKQDDTNVESKVGKQKTKKSNKKNKHEKQQQPPHLDFFNADDQVVNSFEPALLVEGDLDNEKHHKPLNLSKTKTRLNRPKQAQDEQQPQQQQQQNKPSVVDSTTAATSSTVAGSNTKSTEDLNTQNNAGDLKEFNPERYAANKIMQKVAQGQTAIKNPQRIPSMASLLARTTQRLLNPLLSAAQKDADNYQVLQSAKPPVNIMPSTPPPSQNDPFLKNYHNNHDEQSPTISPALAKVFSSTDVLPLVPLAIKNAAGFGKHPLDAFDPIDQVYRPITTTQQDNNNTTDKSDKVDLDSPVMTGAAGSNDRYLKPPGDAQPISFTELSYLQFAETLHNISVVSPQPGLQHPMYYLIRSPTFSTRQKRMKHKIKFKRTLLKMMQKMMNSMQYDYARRLNLIQQEVDAVAHKERRDMVEMVRNRKLIMGSIDAESISMHDGVLVRRVQAPDGVGEPTLFRMPLSDAQETDYLADFSMRYAKFNAAKQSGAPVTITKRLLPDSTMLIEETVNGITFGRVETPGAKDLMEIEEQRGVDLRAQEEAEMTLRTELAAKKQAEADKTATEALEKAEKEKAEKEKAEKQNQQIVLPSAFLGTGPKKSSFLEELEQIKARGKSVDPTKVSAEDPTKITETPPPSTHLPTIELPEIKHKPKTTIVTKTETLASPPAPLVPISKKKAVEPPFNTIQFTVVKKPRKFASAQSKTFTEPKM